MKSKGSIRLNRAPIPTNPASKGVPRANSSLSNIKPQASQQLDLRECEEIDGIAIVPPLLALKEKMTTESIEAVMQSGRYLTSEQIAELSGLDHRHAGAQLKKWINAGKIFEINFQDTDYYPDFGLDPANHYHPFIDLKPVLDVFSGHKSPWRIAFWFCAVNGFLQGRCPQDLLQQDPALVLAAAKDEVKGIQHG